MRNLHSLLLKPLPKGAKPKRSRLPRRLLLILFIGTFFAIPAFIMMTRILPKQGIGFVFYWIHDHVFLPLKGYTYTLFYPYSLSWWGPLLTVLLLWLIAYLTMVSFIKDPHAWVLGKVVRRHKRHPVLVKTSRWLKKWRMEPVLLTEVTRLEREKALYRLMTIPFSQGDETAIRGAVYLTRLHIDLMTLPPVKKAEEIHLEALYCWHRTFMQVRVRLRQNPQADGINTLITQMAAQAETLLLPFVNHRDEVRLQEALAQRPGFDTVSTAVDLLYLAALFRGDLAVRLLGASAAANGETVKKAVCTRLAVSLSRRRAVLEEIRTRLEKLPENIPGPYSLHKSELFESILKNHIPVDAKIEGETTGKSITILSRLSLSLALDLAALLETASPGLDYIDTLETYDFVFHYLEWEPGEEPESPYFTVLRSLNQLPEPGDYRLAAELAEIELNRDEALWKSSILKDDGTIKAEDFQLTKTRVQSLYHAAGPDLDKP